MIKYTSRFIFLFASCLGALSATAQTIPIDSDNDGLPDTWENQYFLDPADPNDAYLDNDNDGLPNFLEFLNSTNPLSADTDTDGMPDGFEDEYQLNPLNATDAGEDIDFDGLTNYEEYIAGSNIRLTDTDSDTLDDLLETQLSTLPNDADSDNDGLSDGIEVATSFNPLNRDENGNNIVDGFEHGSIIKLSHSKRSNNTPYSISGAAISDNGRYAAFISESNNLLSDPSITDTNNTADVFWVDTLTDETRLVSISLNNTSGNNWSGQLVNSTHLDISADGRFVVFASAASNLTANDNNGTDIFVRDLVNATTEIVSLTSTGMQANGFNISPRISRNGRYIVFRSNSTQLLPNQIDYNAYNSDVFIHDRDTGTTELISVNDANEQGNHNSDNPDVSDDGRFVSFISEADNLITNDTNGSGYNGRDVFVRDRTLNTTRIISVNSAGEQSGSGGNNGYPRISGDGQFVSFTSSAQFDENDNNQYVDAYLHQLSTSTTTRISHAADGGEINGNVLWTALSQDGRYTAYATRASTIHNSAYVGGVYVYDGQENTVSVASSNNTGDINNPQNSFQHVDISSEGRFVQFSSNDSYTPDASGHNSFLKKMFDDTPSPIELQKSGTLFEYWEDWNRIYVSSGEITVSVDYSGENSNIDLFLYDENQNMLLYVLNYNNPETFTFDVGGNSGGYDVVIYNNANGAAQFNATITYLPSE